MSINEETEKLLTKLETLATQFDDEEYGKQVNSRHVADLIDELTQTYREVYGDE